MTRVAFVAPWRSDRVVSPGLQNVCHLDLWLGCAKFVLFSVSVVPYLFTHLAAVPQVFTCWNPLRAKIRV